jgi:hypothetical protein
VKIALNNKPKLATQSIDKVTIVNIVSLCLVFFNFLPRIINIIKLNINPQIDNTKYIFLNAFAYISFESFELRSVIVNLYLSNKQASLIKDKLPLDPLYTFIYSAIKDKLDARGY